MTTVKKPFTQYSFVYASELAAHMCGETVVIFLENDLRLPITANTIEELFGLISLWSGDSQSYLLNNFNNRNEITIKGWDFRIVSQTVKTTELDEEMSQALKNLRDGSIKIKDAYNL
jgi:hypothetical protein